MSLQVFGCPDCEQPFQVDSSQAGQQVRCPGCSVVVQIPDALGDSAAIESEDLSRSPEPPATQEVPEAFACPACESAFGVLASMFGTKMACPHCGQAVSIERQPPSPAPIIDVKDSPSPSGGDAHNLVAPPLNKKKRSPKSGANSETASKPPVAADSVAVTTNKPAAESDSPAIETEAGMEAETVPFLESQSVAHLLPPRFATLDPAFFYRRGSSTDQVLLPQADGGVQAVSNRIVTVVHNGQEYQLISSPRYRRNLDIIVNTVLILIAAVLMMAIWWAIA